MAVTCFCLACVANFALLPGVGLKLSQVRSYHKMPGKLGFHPHHLPATCSIIRLSLLQPQNSHLPEGKLSHVQASSGPHLWVQVRERNGARLPVAGVAVHTSDIRFMGRLTATQEATPAQQAT